MRTAKKTATRLFAMSRRLASRRQVKTSRQHLARTHNANDIMEESAMGIKEVQRANGQIKFHADVRVGSAPRKYGTFDTRKDAETFIAITEASARKAIRASAQSSLQQAAKLGGERNYARARLADVVTDYRESSSCSMRGKKALVPVADLVGNARVGNADDEWSAKYVADVRATFTNRRKPYAYSTIKVQLTYLIKACKWWAKQNKVSATTIGISTECIPEGSDVQRDRRLEHGEYDALMARIKQAHSRADHWRCLVDLCLETGARLQELVLASWDELHSEDRLWKIPAKHTKKKKARKVPLSPKARSVIAELRALRKKGDKRIFQVFPTPTATSCGFRNIVIAAGIKDFRFHDLRHDSISMMIVNNPKVSVRAIMEIVGHADYASFVRYSHLRDDEVIGLFD